MWTGDRRQADHCHCYITKQEMWGRKNKPRPTSPLYTHTLHICGNYRKEGFTDIFLNSLLTKPGSSYPGWGMCGMCLWCKLRTASKCHRAAEAGFVCIGLIFRTITFLLEITSMDQNESRDKNLLPSNIKIAKNRQEIQNWIKTSLKTKCQSTSC